MQATSARVPACKAPGTGKGPAAAPTSPSQAQACPRTLARLVGGHKLAGVLARPQDALYPDLRPHGALGGWAAVWSRAADGQVGVGAAKLHTLTCSTRQPACRSKPHSHTTHRAGGLSRRPHLRALPPLGRHPASVHHHAAPAAARLAQRRDEQEALRVSDGGGGASKSCHFEWACCVAAGQVAPPAPRQPAAPLHTAPAPCLLGGSRKGAGAGAHILRARVIKHALHRHPAVLWRLMLRSKKVHRLALVAARGSVGGWARVAVGGVALQPLVHPWGACSQPSQKEHSSPRWPPTVMAAWRRSSSTRFHSRRSHCHLARKAARPPGTTRSRPDHGLRPLPAWCGGDAGDAGGAGDHCTETSQRISTHSVIHPLAAKATHLLWRCRVGRAPAAPQRPQQSCAAQQPPPAAAAPGLHGGPPLRPQPAALHWAAQLQRH